MELQFFSLIVQGVFSAIFIGSIVAAFLMVKNHEKWVGADPSMPSETASARAYTKVQAFIVWAHVFLLSGSFTFLLH